MSFASSRYWHLCARARAAWGCKDLPTRRGFPQLAGYGLREAIPVRRRRSRASFFDSEVMDRPTVC